MHVQSKMFSDPGANQAIIRKIQATNGMHRASITLFLATSDTTAQAISVLRKHTSLREHRSHSQSEHSITIRGEEKILNALRALQTHNCVSLALANDVRQNFPNGMHGTYNLESSAQFNDIDLSSTPLLVHSDDHALRGSFDDPVRSSGAPYPLPDIGDNARTLNQLNDKSDIPEKYQCQLTNEIMTNPVYDPAHSKPKDPANSAPRFEKGAIEHALLAKPENPFTHTPLDSKSLVLDEKLQKEIKTYVESRVEKSQGGKIAEKTPVDEATTMRIEIGDMGEVEINMAVFSNSIQRLLASAPTPSAPTDGTSSLLTPD